MNNLVSWFFRIVAILAGAAAIAVAVLTMDKVKEKDQELQAKQEQLADVQDQLEVAKNDVSRNKDGWEAAKTDIEAHKTTISEMRKELGAARGKAGKLEKDNQSLEEQLRALKGEVSGLNQQLIDERTKVPEVDPVEFQIAQQRAEKLEKQVEKLKERLSQLQTNPDDLPTPDLMAKGAMEGDKPAGPEGIEAVVLASRPELGLLVLDIGSDNGLIENDMLNLHRGERLMARVRIGQLLTDRAVGFILPSEGVPMLIEDNDVVNVVR